MPVIVSPTEILEVGDKAQLVTNTGDIATNAGDIATISDGTHTVSYVQAVAATASIPLMICPPSGGRIISVKARAGAGAAAGESLTVDVHKGGVSMLTAVATLDNAAGTTPQDGTVDAGAPGAMAEDDLITFETTYVAGGGPTPIVNTEITVEFRLD